MTDKEIEELVYNYKTKHKEGFTGKEVKDILAMFPDINLDKFYDVLHGITCIMSKDGLITFHCDVVTALRCGIENRNIEFSEWD